MTDVCATCRYFNPHGTGPNGECRRYPMVVIKGAEASCGEFLDVKIAEAWAMPSETGGGGMP